MSRTEAEVLQFLESATVAHRILAVAGALDLPASIVNAAMWALKRDGLVRRIRLRREGRKKEYWTVAGREDVEVYGAP